MRKFTPQSKHFYAVLLTAVLFSTNILNVFAQCRSIKPSYLTNPATNPNANNFIGTILIGTVEADASEFPLQAIAINNQDANVFNPLWNPPKYNGPLGNQWTSAALGNLFGVTLDRAGNIYAASAGSIFADGTTSGSLSGNHSGAIYRIDANTGLASNFVNLTQDDANQPADNILQGPGLGDVTTDYATPLNIYASNFEDGRIYRMDANANVLGTYDHGTQGRPNAANVAGLEAISDTNQNQSYINQISTGITLPGRRVWATEVNNGRLYYSVWWETGSDQPQNGWYGAGININDESRKNEVWSVGLNADGSFNTASVRREFSMSAVSGTGSLEPITDIIFMPNGRMIISTRGMALNGGLFGNFHKGLVIELSGGFPNWTANQTKFAVGQNGNDGSGGLAFDPTGNLGGGRIWATGESLFLGSFNNQQADTFGYQGMNDNGTNQNPSTSVLVDSNATSDQEKGSIGDVDITCGVTTAASATVSGRVLFGKEAVSRASVTIQNTRTNETKNVQTNSFGNFIFSELAVGDSYIVTVNAKKYPSTNQTRFFQLNDSIGDLEFQLSDAPSRKR